MKSPTQALTLTELRQLAAVSGRFDPMPLLARLLPAEVDGAATLAEECDEDLSSGNYRWLLKADIRRRTLGEFREPAEVQQAVRDAPPPDPDDAFGIALRKVITASRFDTFGQAQPRRDENSDVSRAYYAALHFARALPTLAEAKESISAAIAAKKAVIAREQRASSLETVLSNNKPLIGRMKEQARIRAFIAGGYSPKPILVAGIGGVGKSALLTEIVRKTWKGRKSVAIVLDFDRPSLAGAAPAEILREFLRQFEIDGCRVLNGDPEAAERSLRAIRDVRGQLRSQMEHIAESDAGGGRVLTVSAIDHEQQFVELQSSAFWVLRNLPAAVRQQPVLLVLDSFEMITALGSEVISRILELEDLLRTRADLSGLRTVISGRSVDTALRPLADRLAPEAHWLKLGGLSAAEGGNLLAIDERMKELFSPQQRREASKVLGGHPLALKVLTLYCHDRPADDVTRLLDELKSDPGLSAEFAQKFLYTRILDRIRDPALRQLAHPGLVLREVSPDLIRLVLAEACDLGPVDQKESEVLFQRLVAQHWLVELIRPDLARHRPDLRRQMVGAMFAPPRASDSDEQQKRKRELSARARSVSLAAKRFFSTEPLHTDRVANWWASLGPERRELETIYHCALTEQPPLKLDQALAKRVLDGLSEELDVLPTAWRALIKASARAYRTISDAERHTLEGELRIAVETDRIRLLRSSSATQAAREAAEIETVRRQAEVGSMPQSGNESSVIDDKAGHRTVSPVGLLDDDQYELLTSRIVAAFEDADLEKAADAAVSLMPNLGTNVKYFALRPRIHFSPDKQFWRSGLWLGALAWVATKRNAAVLWKETDFGVRTYAQLAAVTILRILLSPPHKVEMNVLRLGDLRNELTLRRQRMDTVEHSRTYAVAIRYYPDDRDKAGGREISTEQLALFSWPFIRLVENLDSDKAIRPPLFRLSIRSFERLLAITREKKVHLRDMEVISRDSSAIAVLRMPEPSERPVFFAALRGLTPELYQPTANIIRSLSLDVSEAIIKKLYNTPFWPFDYNFQAQDGSRSNKQYSSDAMTIVTIADRCGVLLRLLHLLARHDSRADQLIVIHNLITERIFPEAVGIAATASSA